MAFKLDLKDLESKRAKVGKVIVTKNPCSHPGDIRLLEPVSLTTIRQRITEELFPKKSGLANKEEALAAQRGVLERQSEALFRFFQVPPSGLELDNLKEIEEKIGENNKKIYKYYQDSINVIMFSTQGDRPD